MYAIGNIQKSSIHSLLTSLTIGHICAVIAQMGNSMLTFSFLSSILISLWVVLMFDSEVKYHSCSWGSFLRVGFATGLGVLLKMTVQSEVQDSHISSMLLSKLGIQPTNFHTSLYTCAPEFQALSWDYLRNITRSLLLPYSIMSLLGVAVLWIRRTHGWFSCPLFQNLSHFKQEPYQAKQLHADASSNGEVIYPPLLSYLEPHLIYNFSILLLFIVMSLVAMRLKLFLTPQLCIIVSLLASKKVFSSTFNSFLSKMTRSLLLTVMISIMSKPGIEFLLSRHAAIGEYSNYPLEDLLSWVQDYTPANAAFAGPMPVTASILLSTGRPIVNHPHYEDVNVRRRTQDVYSIFSRKSSYDVFLLLHNLRVNYVVLSADKCFEENARRSGCKMTEIWDLVDPENRGRQPLCPQLFYGDPVPFPFLRVYNSQEYAVLQVPSGSI